MTQPDDEQKKRECWEEFVNMLNHNSAARYVFDKIFDRAYALGKQEKDAEGEEMLYCERDTLMMLYSKTDSVKVRQALEGLFGSKCLPDDTKDDTKDGTKNDTKDGTKNDTKESKPAEPKYNIGQYVRHKTTRLVDVISGVSQSAPYIYHFKHIVNPVDGQGIFESDLEPYNGTNFHEGDQVIINAPKSDIHGKVGIVKYLDHVDDGMIGIIYDSEKCAYVPNDCLEPYTEPKYHKGEKVCYNGYVYEIEGLVGKNRYALKGLNFDLDEDMIEPYEPYTEPDTSHETPVCENHSDNTSQKEVNMNRNRYLSKNIADCDKCPKSVQKTHPDFGHSVLKDEMVDSIIKDSFRNERRLNIATTIMAGVMANPNIIKSRGDLRAISDEWLASRTLELADTLISECEEGGSHD